MFDSEALRYRAEFSHYRDDGDDGEGAEPINWYAVTAKAKGTTEAAERAKAARIAAKAAERERHGS